MFASFKNQRDEELALMTPVEQAKYLTVMGQWRQKMMDKRDQKGRRGEEIIQNDPVIFQKDRPTLWPCRWDCLPGPQGLREP